MSRASSSRIVLACSALVLALLPAAAVSADSAGSPPQPSSAVRGGESWYGTVEWSGRGSANVEGGVYVSHDTHRARAVKNMEKVVIDSTIDSKITRPDPDPLNDGCWTKLETWTGTGTTRGYLQVIEEGARYQIGVYATDSMSVLHEIRYGGFIGGEPCSLGDVDELTTFSPFARIYSGRQHETSFRAGKQKTKSLEGFGSCAAAGLAECTEPLTFLHWPPTASQWSITQDPCTGFSRSYRLGGDDTAFVFKPCQTKSLSSRVSFLHEFSGVPKLCDYVFVGRVSQACTGYKAMTAVQWAQSDWFMYNAARHDACGIWVVDKADWRPPKIRVASGVSGDLTWISPGTSVQIEAKKGYVKVTCPA